MSVSAAQATNATETPILPRHRFSMLLLLLTNRCNLSCRHCYVSSNPHGAHGLPLPSVLEFIDALVAHNGPLGLSLSGGEALARRDDALAILQHVQGRLPNWLLTNGTLITRDVASDLVATDTIVRISLDGGNAATHDAMRGAGAWARLMRGLEHLNAAGLPPARLQAFCTLPAEHVDEISAVLAMAKQLGIDRIKFEPVCKTGRAAESWPGVPEGIDDPDTLPVLDYFKNEFVARHGDDWRLIDLEPRDLSWDTLNVYADGRVYPYTWTNAEDERSGYLGNMLEAAVPDLLEPARLSQAIITKFITLARWPRRRLHAYSAHRRRP
jgi:MoaA/NifB/PqqE/SkfB family radical SAM enzyme